MPQVCHRLNLISSCGISLGLTSTEQDQLKQQHDCYSIIKTIKTLLISFLAEKSEKFEFGNHEYVYLFESYIE
jgi:hypothetical protein